MDLSLQGREEASPNPTRILGRMVRSWLKWKLRGHGSFPEIPGMGPSLPKGHGESYWQNWACIWGLLTCEQVAD